MFIIIINGNNSIGLVVKNKTLLSIITLIITKWKIKQKKLCAYNIYIVYESIYENKKNEMMMMTCKVREPLLFIFFVFFYFFFSTKKNLKQMLGSTVIIIIMKIKIMETGNLPSSWWCFVISMLLFFFISVKPEG